MGLLGLLRNIFRALLGPLLIYFIIASHVAYQIGFKEPEPLSITQWPATTKAEDKQAIIDARKPIIREFMDFLGGKNAEFFKQHATEDIDWEDPIERITGLNEVDGFARLATRLCKNAEIEIFSENHAPHEIIMDWKLTVRSLISITQLLKFFFKLSVLGNGSFEYLNLVSTICFPDFLW